MKDKTNDYKAINNLHKCDVIRKECHALLRDIFFF